MRVLIVNTSEQTGGAAVAANRLKDALNNNGIEANMLVRDKLSDDKTVFTIKNGWRTRWNKLWERWCIFRHLHFSKHNLFAIDIANAGTDITQLQAFKDADVVHLAWINQGMLSLKGIEKILKTGKPLVWTMHDIWPATAVCHITLDCRQFETQCKECRLLPSGVGRNLVRKTWKRKEAIEGRSHIIYITCSKWLQGEAKRSALIGQNTIECIPNPIDTNVFCKSDKVEARRKLGLPADKRLILFASQRVTNRNKGMSYLVDACRKMVEQHPETLANTAVVVLGSHAEDLREHFDLPMFPLGYVSDTQQIVDVYNAIDVFVLPSLSDNLPNTIMEAMACGVPCVGFKVGGIPEMIDHERNGYVVKMKDAADLAYGINWVLNVADYEKLSSDAVEKVKQCYSQARVATQYIDIYKRALAYSKNK
ncbi:glycosyltransferase family 4 protein [Prevotella falsenii]|uniref:glycosyltransferase family 4 protein n=1 Tax=Prevotella falsenii TaxID=515414 RepID=UPI000468FB0E|nr:glycosyltransferase family 4 protein [Prevotella falsenii]